MKKALIHNPYWDSMGGGERYAASVAKVLIDAGWKVSIDWKDVSLASKLGDWFGLNVNSVQIVPDPSKGFGYDLCFWVSDGSIPLLFSRQNILHFQIPFQNVKGKNFWVQKKIKMMSKVVCNSNFTKNVIDKEFGIVSDVLYPPVDIEKFRLGEKEKIVLYVGRFSNLKQNKNQRFLAEVFSKFQNEPALAGWKLILAGGVGVGGEKLLEELKSLASSQVEFMQNPKFSDLVNLYSRAKVFLSAAGFGVDEISSPEKMEHFGISVVEAMAAGCIPIVYNGGGYKEIVDNASGFLWKTQEELVKILLKVVRDENTDRFMAQNAVKAAGRYSLAAFAENFKTLCRI